LLVLFFSPPPPPFFGLAFRWPFIGPEQLVVPQYVSSFLGGG
jgi:hypothetical protein